MALTLTRAERWLTGLVTGLAIPVHAAGLAIPDLYRDPAPLLPQNRATDLITLFLGIPLLLAARLATARGSLRARLLLVGTFGFLAYDYGMYALGVRWNPLFLGYLALFALSWFGVILGFLNVEVERIPESSIARSPRRTIAGYLIGVAIVVGAVWLSEEVTATLGGSVPASVTEFQTPTNIVHVFDLGIVLPAMVVAGMMLLRRRPWGLVLSSVLLVKATAIGVWVLVMMWFMERAGYPTELPQLVLFALLTIFGFVFSWRLFRELPTPNSGLRTPNSRG